MRGRKPDLAKRGAIVAAARDEFFALGFEAATIEGIAARAGVSKVTIYGHFGDKDGLFTAAVESECAKIRDPLLLDDETVPLKQRLTSFGRSMVAFLERPEMIAFEHRLSAETSRHPELGERFLEAGPRRMHRALSDMLDRANERGELQVEDSKLAAEQLAAMFKGLADVERRFGGDPTQRETDRRVEAAVAMFMRSYAADVDPTD